MPGKGGGVQGCNEEVDHASVIGSRAGNGLTAAAPRRE